MKYQIINSKSKEEIEYYLFKEISGKIKEKERYLISSEILAYLDVIISFAVTAYRK